jgi:predicted RNA-binding protein with PIN domain
MEEYDVPKGLRQVRRFAPGRRASAGATPLLIALDQDPAFRRRVAEAIRADVPGPQSLARDDDSGADPDDPVGTAVLAYLGRGAGWVQTFDAAVDDLRARADEVTVRKARSETERWRARVADAERRAQRAEAANEQVRQDAAEQVAAIRRELRRHRSAADRARSQAKEAAQRLTTELAAAQELVDSADLRAARADRELAMAQDTLAALRRAEREGRSLAGARARLLLDTVIEASAGLRDELALPPVGLRPADLVGTDPAAEQTGGPLRGRAQDDTVKLGELLALPRAHLVVDGYNVTKSSYGELPLVDQRARLLTGLAAVGARTGAEITCCFDGAALQGRVASASSRGVRVRFSEPGSTADDLIRRLAWAEPAGRVVVVVSSDREVADGARRSGAWAVPSSALLRFLERS